MVTFKIVKIECNPKLVINWRFLMTVKLVHAHEEQFTTKKNVRVEGWRLVFLNTQTGETYRHFVSNDNLKGFDEELICEVDGPDVEISTDVRTFDGVSKVVLDKIVQLGK